jgi:predicted RNA binding protein YcfA (HicA-like mRNA interferase family)
VLGEREIYCDLIWAFYAATIKCSTIVISYNMPKKIRELIAMLTKAGFKNRGGKGSHRNFLHPSGVKMTISGKSGADALKYQEKDVASKIEEASK